MGDFEVDFFFAFRVRRQDRQIWNEKLEFSPMSNVMGLSGLEGVPPKFRDQRAFVGLIKCGYHNGLFIGLAATTKIFPGTINEGFARTLVQPFQQ